MRKNDNCLKNNNNLIKKNLEQNSKFQNMYWLRRSLTHPSTKFQIIPIENENVANGNAEIK